MEMTGDFSRSPMRSRRLPLAAKLAQLSPEEVRELRSLLEGGGKCTAVFRIDGKGYIRRRGREAQLVGNSVDVRLWISSLSADVITADILKVQSEVSSAVSDALAGQGSKPIENPETLEGGGGAPTVTSAAPLPKCRASSYRIIGVLSITLAVITALLITSSTNRNWGNFEDGHAISPEISPAKLQSSDSARSSARADVGRVRITDSEQNSSPAIAWFSQLFGKLAVEGEFQEFVSFPGGSFAAAELIEQIEADQAGWLRNIRRRIVDDHNSAAVDEYLRRARFGRIKIPKVERGAKYVQMEIEAESPGDAIGAIYEATRRGPLATRGVQIELIDLPGGGIEIGGSYIHLSTTNILVEAKTVEKGLIVKLWANPPIAWMF